MTPARVDAAGFSLVETLVAVAILALVVGLAVPYVRDGRRAEQAAGETLSALRQARIAARREFRVVDIAGANGAAIRFYPDGSSSGGDVTVGAVVWRIDRLSGRIARAP
ncbi:MAG: prepilin-type N-terminal cleavage/methylation domain-containing protein [Alphaproteobacteria bacterium]|nr:prepilin-type N-terminal cleavage/methylation domain-containing protein [Alphaproteobacteria bacterium]